MKILKKFQDTGKINEPVMNAFSKMVSNALSSMDPFGGEINTALLQKSFEKAMETHKEEYDSLVATGKMSEMNEQLSNFLKKATDIYMETYNKQ